MVNEQNVHKSMPQSSAVGIRFICMCVYCEPTLIFHMNWFRTSINMSEPSSQIIIKEDRVEKLV